MAFTPLHSAGCLFAFETHTPHTNTHTACIMDRYAISISFNWIMQICCTIANFLGNVLRKSQTRKWYKVQIDKIEFKIYADFMLFAVVIILFVHTKSIITITAILLKRQNGKDITGWRDPPQQEDIQQAMGWVPGLDGSSCGRWLPLWLWQLVATATARK